MMIDPAALLIDPIPLLLSLRLALTTMVILLIVGLPLAWFFARSNWLGLPFIEAFFSISMVLPPTVLGFYLLFFFSPYAPLGAWLEQVFGLRLVFSFEGMVLASCISSFPFMFMALKNSMLLVPHNVIEASYTLGRGRVQTFLRIVLPLIRGGVLSGLVMTFARTLGEFGVVLMVGGSIPGLTQVVSIAIFERAEAQDFAGAHTYALVLVLISYAAVLIMTLAERAQRLRRV